jgi:hypothetical protein
MFVFIKKFNYKVNTNFKQHQNFSFTWCNFLNFLCILFFLNICNKSYSQILIGEFSNFYENPFFEKIYIPPLTINDLTSIEKEIIQVKCKEIYYKPSIHNNAIKIKYIRYFTKEYMVEYYKKLNEEKYYRTILEISNNEINLKYGIKIGLEESATKKIIGKYHREYFNKAEQKIIIKRVGEYDYYPIVFIFKENRLIFIQLQSGD